MLSRTPQFSRQKHTSEHFFYRTASNGCFQISTIFLKKEKTEKKFHSTRSSHPEVFCKKSVLKSFTKFKGKHLCRSLFFNKIAGLQGEKQFHSKNNLLEMSCFHAKLRSKSAPQKPNLLMKKAISKRCTLECSCKCHCTFPHKYAQ